MNNETMKGNWNEIKGRIKNRWGKLTDDQVMQSEGDMDRLMGEIQKTYGYTKDEAEREYEDFRRSLQ